MKNLLYQDNIHPLKSIMKNLFYLPIFLISFNVFSQELGVDVFFNIDDNKFYKQGKLFSGTLRKKSSFVNSEGLITINNGVIEGEVNLYGAIFSIFNGKLEGKVLLGGWSFEAKNGAIISFPKYQSKSRKISYKIDYEKSILYETEILENKDSIVSTIPFLKGSKISDFFGIDYSEFKIYDFESPKLMSLKIKHDKGFPTFYRDNKIVYESKINVTPNGERLLLYKVQRDIYNNFAIIDSVYFTNPSWADQRWNKNIRDGKITSDMLNALSEYHLEEYKYKNGELDVRKKNYTLGTYYTYKYYYPIKDQRKKELFRFQSYDTNNNSQCPYAVFTRDKKGNKIPVVSCLYHKNLNKFILNEYFPDGFLKKTEFVELKNNQSYLFSGELGDPAYEVLKEFEFTSGGYNFKPFKVANNQGDKNKVEETNAIDLTNKTETNNKEVIKKELNNREVEMKKVYESLTAILANLNKDLDIEEFEEWYISNPNLENLYFKSDHTYLSFFNINNSTIDFEKKIIDFAKIYLLTQGLLENQNLADKKDEITEFSIATLVNLGHSFLILSDKLNLEQFYKNAIGVYALLPKKYKFSDNYKNLTIDKMIKKDWAEFIRKNIIKESTLKNFKDLSF
jgi:hypothetical protein